MARGSSTGGRSLMETALLVLVVVLLGVVFGAWVLLYQLVKQQGRLLLRLDRVDGGQGTVDEELATIAPFELPDLSGRLVSLDDFRGKQILLVHWSPHCGFCDLIAPDLAVLDADLARAGVRLVLVSEGEVGANQTLAAEHGLACSILLQSPSRSVAAFERVGTPVAYLVDDRGRVIEGSASGADAVCALARRLAGADSARKRLPGQRPLSESRIERDGLSAGTPAPVFRLPDLDGRTVSLDEYRGRRVLLVFTDPRCGPCDALGPQLVWLHRDHGDDFAVIMVGRGGVEENRGKSAEHGFEFPVVLQADWKLSREYGIFAAPVAFLIDEEGVIARGVAKGVEEIMALATSAQRGSASAR